MAHAFASVNYSTALLGPDDGETAGLVPLSPLVDYVHPYVAGLDSAASATDRRIVIINYFALIFNQLTNINIDGLVKK